MTLFLIPALLWIEIAIFLKRYGSLVKTAKAAVLVVVASLASNFVNIAINPEKVYGIASLEGSAQLAGVCIWTWCVSSVVEYALIRPFTIKLKALDFTITIMLMNFASHLLLALSLLALLP